MDPSPVGSGTFWACWIRPFDIKNCQIQVYFEVVVDFVTHVLSQGSLVAALSETLCDLVFGSDS